MTEIRSIEDGKVKSGSDMMKVWEVWFRRLLNPVEEKGFDEDFRREVGEWNPQRELGNDKFPELSADLSKGEVALAMRRLKAGKAVGIDEVLGETLRLGGEKLEGKVWELLNQIFEEGVVPEEWGTGLIVPVFKGKGCRLGPDNYRGITLLSVVSKLFASILSNRLMCWAEREGVLADEQGALGRDAAPQTKSTS